MKRLLWPLLLGAVVLALDQASKLWVAHAFALGESLPVLPGCFALTYVRNQGAAWGMFQGAQLLLGGLGVVAAALLAIFHRAFLGEGRAVRLLTALLVSGILGNVIDRFWHGYVIDFFHVYWRTWHFPCFNVADSAICLAVGVLLLLQVLPRRHG